MKTWICAIMSNFLGPSQGTARLYAYIKKMGHDVSYKDFNQESYFTLLSRKYLENTFEKLKSMLFPITKDKFLRENIGSILLNSSHNYMQRLLAEAILCENPWYSLVKNISFIKKILSAIVSSRVNNSNIIYALLHHQQFILSEIDKAQSTLDRHFLSLPIDEFLLNFQTLLCGKALIDAVYFPAQLDFGLGFEGTEYRPHAADIVHAVSDERHNFLIPYYLQEVLPLLDKEKPGIVGISMTHTSEFVPAFTLARLIKSIHPEIHICLGGAVATEIAYRIQNNPSLWDFFDSLILGPGEYVFDQLIEHIENKKDLSGIPNIIYKDKNSIKKTDKVHHFNLNDACTPEYVCLRPKSILPLETSSGCYWGKCVFCYYPKEGVADISDSRNTRMRDIELVLEDIKKLREAHDPLYVGITDSSLHPKRIERIAEENLKGNKIVKFSGFIRFEKEFKSRAFCEKIKKGGFLGGQAGLESGSQRVNRIINKGVNLKDVKVILKNFYKVGIALHIYTLVGMPGETAKDAQLTLDFLRRYHRMITLDWQVYPLRVLEHSPIAERADELGVTVEPLPNGFLAQVMKYDVKNGLSQKESIALSIRFTEKLKRFLNPLYKIMDTEMYKLFLVAKKVKNQAHPVTS